MGGRNMLFETEIAEELRRSRLTSHHSPEPPQITQRIASRVHSASNNDEFFNSIDEIKPLR
ncbi:hypothetical protein SM0020_29875 [Sinorhizobium meliloti CCNWSX0020]|uniref:Uncharacterized protein n=1 Tax=Sinorhizobium meliloti CCNWSX0020 TaxID=1107881 RepID=H0G8Y2_RHIML|nr:hypothetical protein SM0020_29875 [Sinorhizobium meliloti CCNWSX0020]